MVTEPNFVNSPYFVAEPDHWHLLPGAPKGVQDEFDAWMKQQQNANERGVSL